MINSDKKVESPTRQTSETASGSHQLCTNIIFIESFIGTILVNQDPITFHRVCETHSKLFYSLTEVFIVLRCRFSLHLVL